MKSYKIEKMIDYCRKEKRKTGLVFLQIIFIMFNIFFKSFLLNVWLFLYVAHMVNHCSTIHVNTVVMGWNAIEALKFLGLINISDERRF